MKLYLKYLALQLKSDLEYRNAFIVSIISKTASSIFSFISILFLFEKFGSVDGYSFQDVLICFVMAFLGFSLAECFFRSFDHFDRLISNGEFDRILVRPRSVILQVLGSEVEFNRIGRAVVAIFIFVGLLVKNPVLLQLDKLVTLILMIVCTVVIYSALFVMKAGITFFTIQGLEIMNIFTDGARDLTQYPLNIYHEWVKKFFTYILPLAFVNYYPLLYVIGRSENVWYMFAPLVALLFVVPCYGVWRVGLKRYRSVGS